MWTRFLNGFLKPDINSHLAKAIASAKGKLFLNITSGMKWKKPLHAGIVSAGIIAVLSYGIPAVYAQNGVDRESANQKFAQDAFIQLRFTALSLDTLDEVGQALEGLVRALLAKGDQKSAFEEALRIEDPLWKARANISISKYHRIHKNIPEARKSLSLAFEQTKNNDTSDRKEFSQHIYNLLSSEYARLGDLKNSVSTTGYIENTIQRMTTLQKAAKIFLRKAEIEDDKVAEENALKAKAANKKTKGLKKEVAAILRATFKEASSLPGASQTLIDVFINISRSQARAGDTEGSASTLEYALDKVRSQKDVKNWHTRALARIASAYTFAKGHSKAMDVMRSIPEGGERAIALSAVARSMAEINNIDAALPLFTLAKEQVRLEFDDARRHRILSLLIRDQAFVGRLADAFTTAGGIKNREAQAQALMNMGFVLLDQKKFDEASSLLNYIPYLGMRAPIFASLASAENSDGKNPTKASALLAQALEPVSDNPLKLKLLPAAIKSVLSAQLNYGSPDFDAEIFKQAMDLTKQIPDNLTRVNALAHLATAEAARGRKEEAKKIINAAWTLAFLHNEGPDYSKALANITQSQIATEQMLDAMDTAARIPAPIEELLNDRAPDGSFRSARFDSITSVGVAAAKLKDTDMAIRTARLIKHPPARAAALAAVAVAIALPEASLRDIVGIGPTDKWSYDFITVENRALEITEQSVIGQQDIMETDSDGGGHTNDSLLEELAHSEL